MHLFDFDDLEEQGPCCQESVNDNSNVVNSNREGLLIKGDVLNKPRGRCLMCNNCILWGPTQDVVAFAHRKCNHCECPTDRHEDLSSWLQEVFGAEPNKNVRKYLSTGIPLEAYENWSPLETRFFLETDGSFHPDRDRRTDGVFVANENYDNNLTLENACPSNISLKAGDPPSHYTSQTGLDGHELWQIVGGSKEGGLQVREGLDLKSTKLSKRLSTCALVHELDLKGDRLHYRRLTGIGPDEGWINIKHKNTVMACRIDRTVLQGSDKLEIKPETEQTDVTAVVHANSNTELPITEDASRPLCSVICPTTDDRHSFHRLLYQSYQGQIYTPRELVVIDTGSKPSPFFLKKIKYDPSLVYRWLGPEGKISIGTKRNIACLLAKGTLIAHFDDDDLYGEDYLMRMVKEVLHAAPSPGTHPTAATTSGVVEPTALSVAATLATWHTFDTSQRVFRLLHAVADTWIYGWGFSFVYTKAAWRGSMFPDMDVGEDFEFMMALKKRKSAQVVVVEEEEGICSHTYHPHLNVSGGERQHNKPIGREVPAPEKLSPLVKTLLEIDPARMAPTHNSRDVTETKPSHPADLATCAIARPLPPESPQSPPTHPEGPTEYAPQVTFWIVVGGGEKGGILVREELSLGSEAYGERLATGAVIQQIEIEGERLHYTKMIGSGPCEGWISTCLDHKVLARPYLRGQGQAS